MSKKVFKVEDEPLSIPSLKGKANDGEVILMTPNMARKYLAEYLNGGRTYSDRIRQACEVVMEFNRKTIRETYGKIIVKD